MGMPAHSVEWTVDMARTLPDDGQRYEVLDGELRVTPAPSLEHQRAVFALYDRLKPYVTAHALGELLGAPVDIQFSHRRLVQPDLLVARFVAGRRPRESRDIQGLRLWVEVISASTARADRTEKSRIAMQEDVDEYWIVDVVGTFFERWRRSEERPEIVRGPLVWQPDPDVPPLIIDLAGYFRFEE